MNMKRPAPAFLAICIFSSAALLVEAAASDVDVIRIRGPVYLLAGAGGNIVASIGDDGVLLVDSGTAEMADKVLETIGKIQQAQIAGREPKPLNWGAEGRLSILAYRDGFAPVKPVRYIINTSAAPDHVGGNARIRQSGVTYVGGNVTGNISDAGEGASIYAREEVLFRLTRAGKPSAMYPTDTYHGPSYKLSQYVNGDGVRMVHMQATSDADTLVYLTRADVIVTGDFFSQTSYPYIDLEHGGSIDGVIRALNYVLDLAVPEFRYEGGTMIVPGHGRLSDAADVGYYRDMVTIIRDNVREMIKRGMTLEQVLAARPTKGYDVRFGSDAGSWTTRDFVEAVYKSLTKAP
jgi:cyclase